MTIADCRLLIVDWDPLPGLQSSIVNYQSSMSFPSHLPIPPCHPGLAFALDQVPVHLRGDHLLFDVARPIGKLSGGKVRARGKTVGVPRGQELRLGTANPFDERLGLERVPRAA